MKEKLITVIDRIIIPRFPNIVNYTINRYEKKDVKYNPEIDRSVHGTIREYNVVYFFNLDDSLDDKLDFNNIAKETKSLFEMLGPEIDEKIKVTPNFNIK